MNESTPRAHQRIVFHKHKGPAGLWRRLDGLCRRLLDLVAAALGLAILSPGFALIALLIKRDSEGPVFYWGPRVGRGGRRFHILKFRTMYERPASYDGPGITVDGDERITPVGRWLRDTKLNELPQLWNVLMGHMSLVGPRPEDPDFVEEWPPQARREVLSVRPGITSPASVLYREEEQLLSSGNVVDGYLRDILPGKLRLDLLYVRHRTLLSDLDVIFWTAVTLLPRLGRKEVPQHALYWGPLSRFLSRHFTWFLVDLVVALVAVVAAGLLWRSGGPLDLGSRAALVVALGTAFLFGVVNVLLGRVYWSKASSHAVFDLAFSSALATGLLALVNYFWPGRPLPVGLLLLTGLLAFLGFTVARYRIRILTGLATRWMRLRGPAGTVGERVLIVGAGDVGEFAIWLLRKGHLARAFSLVGLVDDAPRKQGVRVEGLPVLGTAADIPHLVQEHDVGLLIYAIEEIDAGQQEQILDLCRQTAARLVVMPHVLNSLRSHFAAGHRAPDGNAENGPAQEHAVSPATQRLLCELDDLIAGGDRATAQAKLQALRRHLSSHHPPPDP